MYRILTLVMSPSRLDFLVRKGSILDPCYDMWECYISLQQLTLLCMSLLITVWSTLVRFAQNGDAVLYLVVINKFWRSGEFFMQGMLCMHVCKCALLSWYICNIINDYSFQYILYKEPTRCNFGSIVY